MFLSTNAGCIRLLLPDARKHWLTDMKTGVLAIITRGAMAEHDGRDALEILFEDHSDSPFSIIVGKEQIDLIPANKDQDVVGQDPKWMCAIYTEKDGKVFEIPARYRRVDKLPCLKEWGKI